LTFYFDSTVNFLALILSLIAVILSAVTLLYAMCIHKTENEIKENQQTEKSQQKDRAIMLVLSKYKNFIINLKSVRNFQRWVDSKSTMEPGDVVAPVEYNLAWNVNNTIRRAYTFIEFVEYGLPHYPDADSRILEWKAVILENAEKLAADNNSEDALLELERAMGVSIGFLDEYEPMSTKYRDSLQKHLGFYREHTKFIAKVHGNEQAKDIIHPDYSD